MKTEEIIYKLIRQLVAYSNLTEKHLEEINKFPLIQNALEADLGGTTLADFQKSFRIPLALQCSPFGFRMFFISRNFQKFRTFLGKNPEFFENYKLRPIIALNAQLADLNEKLSSNLKDEELQKLILQRNLLLAKKMELVIQKPLPLKEQVVLFFYKTHFFKTNPNSREALPTDLLGYIDQSYERYKLPSLPIFYAVYMIRYLAETSVVEAMAKIGLETKLSRSLGSLNRYDCAYISEERLQFNQVNAEPNFLSLFHAACICNNEIIFRDLLKAVKLPYEKFFGFNLLHWAAQLGYAKMVNLLLECGAEVNAKGFGGLAALHLAVRNQHGEIAHMLIANGADVNAVDDQGRSPFFMACVGGDLISVKRLAEMSKVDIMATNSTGLTSVHVAALNGHLEVLKYLIKEKGLDPHSNDQTMNSPFYLAYDYILECQNAFEDVHVRKNVAVLKWYLEENYIKPNKDCWIYLLDIGFIHEDQDFILILLKNKAFLSEEVMACPFSNSKATILHHANYTYCSKVILYLIENETDKVKDIINLRDEDGGTVLHLEAKDGNTDMYEKLLTVGADSSLQNEDGKTAIELLEEALEKTKVINNENEEQPESSRYKP